MGISSNTSRSMTVPEELLLTAAAGEIDPPPTHCGAAAGAAIGILAFEAASAMARLVSLHRSLSGPAAARRLISNTSSAAAEQGISYLNSGDQTFLLTLACAEILDSLDGAAAVISRLDKRRSPSPASGGKGFCRVYSDIKAGIFQPGGNFRFSSSEKAAERRVKRMEKLVASMAPLWTEIQLLDAAERKLAGRQRRHGGGDDDHDMVAAVGALRRRVRRLKEKSLWCETFEGAVGVMAPAALYIFTRVCSVFGPFVPGLTKVVALPEPPEGINSCAIFGLPVLEGTTTKRAAAGLLLRDPRKIMTAPPNTVGGSGMALLYAELIVRAEKMLLSEGADDNDDEKERSREELYAMLPARIRGAVRARLRDRWMTEYSPEVRCDRRLSEGWREAAAAILRWLAPVARATLVWQEEQRGGVERQRRFDTSPRTLLFQTLHFSDVVKTDAAVVEVLVGLSCSRWHGKPRRRSSSSK